VPAADAQHPLVGPYHQCRGTPENRPVNNQRNPTQPSPVSFRPCCTLDPQVPANKALLLMVNIHEGRKPSSNWTRPPGRPRRTWLNLVQEDANAIPLSMENWDLQGTWGGATVRQDYAMMMMGTTEAFSSNYTLILAFWRLLWHPFEALAQHTSHIGLWRSVIGKGHIHKGDPSRCGVRQGCVLARPCNEFWKYPRKWWVFTYYNS